MTNVLKGIVLSKYYLLTKTTNMTQIAIQKQIDVIKQASANALKSKESALKFLVSAGIVKPDNAAKSTSTTGKKK